MLDRQGDIHLAEVVNNRQQFCQANGSVYEDVVYQRIDYHEDATYALVREIDEISFANYHQEVIADAILTRTPGVGIFLPLADCIGLVLHDATHNILAVLHMGRHSTLTNLIEKVVDRMRSEGANPSGIVAWMTPSAGKDSYRMKYFTHENSEQWKGYCDRRDDGIYLDLAGFNRRQLILAGLTAQNIHTSPIDTVTSQDYFSHSSGDASGRFALLAVMR